MIQKGINVDDFSDDNSDSDQEIEQITQSDESALFPETSFCRPIMLMYSGSARCVNKSFPDWKIVAKRLATGSILGESDSMSCVGIDFFGHIYAESNGL